MMIIRFLTSLYKSHFNILSTLYLNFRVFSFFDAIKFPVYVYGNCCFEGLHKGCIQLSRITSHALRIGGGKYTFLYGRSNLYKNYFRFAGTLIAGNNIIIDQGCVLSICKGAKLVLGDNIYINRQSTIHVKQSIVIGENTRIGWNCQILDSDFHYTVNDKGNISYRNKPVIIGHNVWLANHVLVSKGTKLPDYSIVASMSLVNKDLSSLGPKCLLGGVPVKMITSGVRRLLDVENELDRLFINSLDPINIDSIPFINEH